MSELVTLRRYQLPDTLEQLALARMAELNEAIDVELPTEFQHPISQCLALSDFVFNTIMRQPEILSSCLQALTSLVSTQAWTLNAKCDLQPLDTIDDEAQFFAALRRYRHQAMVQITVIDMLRALDGGDVPSATFSRIQDSLLSVSTLADELILSALRWAYRTTQKQWGTPLNADGEALPMIVLGMGKLGGRELNFSSDIDLIFIYAEAGMTQGARRQVDHQQFFVRVAQRLIAALNKVTVDGAVFRVDMRLRPFGDSGPLVASFSALEDYYQNQGREWERYAMVKARVINDCQSSADAIAKLLRPFVYRRYIDFGVIESLRKMKRLIAQETRRRQLVDNIKLGTGGIREVEFIVQAQQMVRGGREKSLQTRSCMKALDILHEQSLFPDDDYHALKRAYYQLREIEHFLQQFADQQTQALPIETCDQLRLSALLDMPSYEAVFAYSQDIMGVVHKEFLQVIGEEVDTEDDCDVMFVHWWELPCEAVPECERPAWLSPVQQNALFQAIESFKHDVNNVRMGVRGRDILDRLMPMVFTQCAAASVSVNTLSQVIAVLRSILSRTAYLDLLLENTGALAQLIRLCSRSRWVAEQLVQYPLLLDDLIDPSIFTQPPPFAEYPNEIQRSLLRVADDDLELQMDVLRQFKLSQQLRIAAADISGALSLMQVSDHLTVLAETLIAQVVRMAWTQMSAKHGQPVGRSLDDMGFIVVGYGKTGGWELGYGSDLDLVFIHNWRSDDAQHMYTDGAKPIDARQFYLKLVQRIIHIFTTKMLSGQLYDVDTRLRPSGNSGPLSIHVDTYADYLEKEAWTWEHQALVRARVVYQSHGVHSQQLFERFTQVREAILSAPRVSETLLSDVKAMRQKMRDHLSKDSDTQFDLKQGIGGIVDIEFMVQYLVLQHAQQFKQLMSVPDNIRLLEVLADVQLLDHQTAEQLIAAYQQLRELQHAQTLQYKDKVVPKDTVEDVVLVVRQHSGIIR